MTKSPSRGVDLPESATLSQLKGLYETIPKGENDEHMADKNSLAEIELYNPEMQTAIDASDAAAAIKLPSANVLAVNCFSTFVSAENVTDARSLPANVPEASNACVSNARDAAEDELRLEMLKVKQIRALEENLKSASSSFYHIDLCSRT